MKKSLHGLANTASRENGSRSSGGITICATSDFRSCRMACRNTWKITSRNLFRHISAITLITSSMSTMPKKHCDTFPVDRSHSAEFVVLEAASADAKVFRDSQRVADSQRDFLLGVDVETLCLS